MEQKFAHLRDLDIFLLRIQFSGRIPKPGIFSQDPEKIYRAQMFNKLLKDGYIEPVNFKSGWYWLSFDGKILLQNGGYLGAEKATLKVKNMAQQEYWILIAGLFIAACSLVLTIYWHYQHHDLKHATVIGFPLSAPKFSHAQFFYNLHYVKYDYWENGQLRTISKLVVTDDIEAYRRSIPCFRLAVAQ